MLSEDDPTRLSLLAQLSLALAKFTRNLVAANKHNQANASYVAFPIFAFWCLTRPTHATLRSTPMLYSENESLIRKLLYHYSSYSSIQDPTCKSTIRVAARTIRH